MDRPCPICNRALTKEHKIKHIDYHCYPPPKDHHYSERLKDDIVLAIKVRLSPDGHKIFFKQDKVENYMEVWTTPDIKEERIRIGSIFEPDFSDIPALFHKMKTYLIFS